MRSDRDKAYALIDSRLPTEVVSLYECIIDLLADDGLCFASLDLFKGADHHAFDDTEWGVVYYEGTDAAPYFCYDSAYRTGAREDYDRIEKMRELLEEHGVYSELSYATAPIYPL